MGFSVKPELPSLQCGHLLARGLIGAWLFYERGGSKIYDMSQYRHDFTLYGTPTWKGSQFGACLNFVSTSSQYASIADIPFFTFGAAGTDSAFTFVAGVKPESSKALNILTKFTNSVGTNEYLWYINSAGPLYLDLYSGANYIGRKSTAAIPVGIHTNVAATYSGNKNSNGIALYADAKRIDTTNDASGSYTGMSDGTAPLMIQGWGTNYANGEISYVLMYNRVLNQEEIAWLNHDPFAAFRPVYDYDSPFSIMIRKPLAPGLAMAVQFGMGF